ncbi:unnamed protein product [Adineta steineri]|uniref:Carrier domain-containing protein n=1 Tax=Adineta steineri TaxID=433720 RepID=A0A815I6E2_9BILA|nr:unnamed protein product [Adineta steineri]
MLSRKRLVAGTNAHKEPKFTISERTEAVASFVQQRIWLHEQLYFHSSDLSVYNILVPLIIKQGSLSIERIRSILLTLIEQHTVLRTAVRFNSQSNQIEQYIQAATNDIYSFKHSRGISTSEQLDRLLTNESIGKHFDIESGRVVRCHIIQRSNDEHDHLLSEGDLVAITFHHISFDNSSLKPLVEAFKKVCLTSCHNQPTLSTPQYIDFTLYEQSMLADTRMDSKMNKAREFWSNLMDGYDWNRIRQLVPGKAYTKQIRSGRGFSTVFSINQHVVDAMMLYASSNNITMFALSLACYYAFLFKLMNDDDLCVAGNVANRFIQETKDMIGMFVNLTPYRMQIEPNNPFDHLVRKVQQLSSNVLEHGCLPYQHIINSYDQRGHQVLPSTLFHYESLMSSITQSIKLEATTDEGSVFGIYFDRDRSHGNGTALFDLSLTIAHDHHSRSTECFLDCSADIYHHPADVDLLANRFQHMLTQFFCTSITDELIYNQSNMPISKLSLILPEEIEEIQGVIFRKLSNIANEVIYSSKGYYGSFTFTAPASYAQTRIWLDERVRFDSGKSQIANYNMPFIYRPFPNHTLSVQQLYNALQLVLAKHQSLHTSLIFDTKENLLMQRIIELNDNNIRLFTLIESTYETDEQLHDIMHDERRNTQHFDLSQGLVFRYHLVYYKEISPNDLLSDKDVIIFNFHHIIFDFSSINIFLNDLNQAYTTSQVSNDDNTALRYLDYAVIEQQMSMSGASMFWLDVLHDCKLDQPLSLPYDRYRLSNEHRTGLGTSVSFDFSQDLSHDFLHYASSHNISLEHLTFAIYFIFLFKLTNDENDLCISINTDNRYKDELKSIIGLFENVIPLRCQLDPHWTSQYLLDYVREITTNSMKYSYFPLERILNQHPHISKPAFLDISFQFLSSMTKSNNKLIMIGDSQLSSISSIMNINNNEITNEYDFSLIILHDLNTDQLSCTINASLDLFNVETINKISQRFHSILIQLFTSVNDQMNKSVYEISLTLPSENLLMQSMNNTQVSFSSPVTCIHHEFVYQVMKHPQKIAVELDEQSLTYCELLYYVQVLSLTLLNEYHVLPGEIVCQCVERSLTMVIGIMSTEMAGGVYCPLSPRDPQHRLHSLTQQTQSRLVLVHHLTKTKFDDNIISLDIDSILNISNMDNDMSYSCLPSVKVKGKEMAYVIFTSGSTGIPKAVEVRHKNFMDCINSLVYINSFNKDDTVVQMTRCSFDIHVQEILGTLLVGGTLIMLHPGGTINFDYLSKCMFIVAGEPFSVPLIGLIVKIGMRNCIVWDLYGPAEATIGSTIHCVDVTNGTQSVPIGRPFYNYRCMIVNQYLQSSVIGQEGELLVGGAGVFAGYLGRDDLTAKGLVEIDGQLFYRTGDLVRMDNNGLLHYQGRKDHQIKLHGQRIELGEIEQCLLRTSISACVVVKGSDDYLVAYVQSSDINEQELRDHCQSHLPPHMIPSLYVILEKLPLNPNGKIDRKLLPPPHFSSIHLTNSTELLQPTNDIEVNIHHIWCDLLKQNQISTDTNLFSIGGHSLLMMQLFHRYKIEFCLETNALSISNLFQHPTIIHHAQLIQQSINIINTIDEYPWSSLDLIQARASFALIIKQGSLSIERIRSILLTLIEQHTVLRTAVRFNPQSNQIEQYIQAATDDIYSFEHSRGINISEQLDQLLINESVGKHFDIEIGRVGRCHIIQRSNDEQDHRLSEGDLVAITFHHISFDNGSLKPFVEAFKKACWADRHQQPTSSTPQYIDFTLYEQSMLADTRMDSKMNKARQFWSNLMDGYDWHRIRQLVHDEADIEQIRSGRGYSTTFSINQHVVDAMMLCASSNNITMFTLSLSCYYAFLFKLINDDDLCVAGNIANRFVQEAKDMIGMFVNLVPYRTKIEPNMPFDHLLQKVQQLSSNILEHGCLPYQHIINSYDQRGHQVLPLTLFHYESLMSSITQNIKLEITTDEDTVLDVYFDRDRSHGNGTALFDLSLTIAHDHHSRSIECFLDCSADIFHHQADVDLLANRFLHMLTQLFGSSMTDDPMHNQYSMPISRLSLILPEEIEEMQGVIFCRLPTIMNEAPASYAQTHIWFDERIGINSNKSQIEAYNMPFMYYLFPNHTLSVPQIYNALQLVLAKHESLHTSLIYDSNKNLLMQRVLTQQDINNDMLIITESTYETDEQLNAIIENEKCNPQLFDLTPGFVFRCHIIYYKQISSNNTLSDKDIIIFNFHYAFFDYPSMNIFLHDLDQAYTTGQLTADNYTSLRYIDCKYI